MGPVQGCFEEHANGGGNDFHDQKGHIVCHLDQFNRLVGQLDQLHNILTNYINIKKFKEFLKKIRNYDQLVKFWQFLVIFI